MQSSTRFLITMCAAGSLIAPSLCACQDATGPTSSDPKAPTSDDAGADGNSDAQTSAPDAATLAACPRTIADACAAPVASGIPAGACCTDGPGCFGRLPTSLAPFCASRANPVGYVSQIADCRGYTIILAPGGVDTFPLYFYDASGVLAAVGGWGNAAEHCSAGRPDLAYPMSGHRAKGECDAIGAPQCCPSLAAEKTYECVSDAGAADGGTD